MREREREENGVESGTGGGCEGLERDGRKRCGWSWLSWKGTAKEMEREAGEQENVGINE